MKRTILLLILTPYLLLACRPSEQEEALQERYEQQLTQQMVQGSAAFNQSLEPLLDAYFDLKDALVASDSLQSIEAAGRLSDSFDNIATESLDDASRTWWEEHASNMVRHSREIQETPGLEEQRIPFHPLSEHLIEIARTFQPSESILFVQSCPMVRGGSAPWLSREEPIRNPYHGDRMMNCGETLERI